MTEQQLGCWFLQRSIVDLQTGVTLSCAGEAHLYADAADIRYVEAVRISIDGRPLKATQTYRYHRNGAQVTARFADGRIFFVTTFAPDGSATAVHSCGPDVYTGTFRLSADGWATDWTVSGTKALHITTGYKRSGVATGA